MALFLDARRTPEWQYRLWDTQAGWYVTGELDRGRMRDALKRMLRNGDVPDSPSLDATLTGWLADAERRGTNDPKQKANADFSRPWREGPEPPSEPSPIRAILHARILTEQVARSVHDAHVLDWTTLLSEPARALLTDACVLAELLRGPGMATLRVPRGNLSTQQPLIDEIARIWEAAITVETNDPGDPHPATFTFRLR